MSYFTYITYESNYLETSSVGLKTKNIIFMTPSMVIQVYYFCQIHFFIIQKYMVESLNKLKFMATHNLDFVGK